MRRSNLLLLVACVVLVLLAWQPAHAQNDGAPVQVQIESDGLMLMYDCYPGTGYGEMVVYLNYPQGVASYTCAMAGGAWIRPLWPLGRYELAAYTRGL